MAHNGVSLLIASGPAPALMALERPLLRLLPLQLLLKGVAAQAGPQVILSVIINDVMLSSASILAGLYASFNERQKTFRTQCEKSPISKPLYRNHAYTRTSTHTTLPRGGGF